MRKLDVRKSEKRKSQILHAAVHHYIKTGLPTSSNILVADYGLKLSSATVRKSLSELEDEGYMVQPHPSSGRIPTDKGYRAYVDMLKSVQNITIGEMDKLRSNHHRNLLELEEVLVNTSKILSTLSHYSGFVSLPSKEKTIVKNIELISLKDKQLLFIFVTNTGLVKHKLLNADISLRNLRHITDFLKEKIEGLAISDAEQSLEMGLADLKIESMELSTLGELIKDLFLYESDFYIDGFSKIMALPEFRDYSFSERLVNTADKRNPLVRVLSDGLSSDNVRVIIGAETHCKGFECISAVTSVYKKDERPLGVLGIIGPKRMEYRKMISIVKQVSQMLGDILGKMESHEEG